MNDLRLIQRHEAFPRTIDVVIEQPPGERFRLDYRPEDGTFHRTGSLSLIHDRGFSGAYGWVGGLGTPPDPHLDVILITREPLRPGDLVTALPCGVFLRADGDHKLVALDARLDAEGAPPDLVSMALETRHEVERLYPLAGSGEGWFGRDRALQLLTAWR